MNSLDQCASLSEMMFYALHPGGVIAYPIAAVRVDEKIKEVKLSDVIFKK